MFRNSTKPNRTSIRYFTQLNDAASPVMATVQAHTKQEARDLFCIALARKVSLAQIERE